MKNPSAKSINLKKRPNAIGYARSATANQVDQTNQSIKNQIKQIKQYCQKQKLKLIKIYSGVGSGLKINPELKKAIKACSKKSIYSLVVYDTSRLSRNTNDYLAIRALLTKSKVKIICLTGKSAEENDPCSKFFDEIITLANSLHPSVSSYGVKKIKRCPTCHQEL